MKKNRLLFSVAVLCLTSCSFAQQRNSESVLYTSDPVISSETSSEAKSLEASLEIERKDNGANYFSGLDLLKKEDDGYYFFLEMPVIPGITEKSKVKISDVSFELFCCANFYDSAFGIPENGCQKWMLEPERNYAIHCRVYFSFPRGNKELRGMYGIDFNYVSLSFGDGANADIGEKNIVRLLNEGSFLLSAEVFGETLTQEIEAKRFIYDPKRINHLSVVDYTETGTVESVSPSKPTFVEGDEYKVETGYVMDGPNTAFFANGVFYSTALRYEDFSFPEETTKSFNVYHYFKMPPFDCTIEVCWEYYTSDGANIQISQA